MRVLAINDISCVGRCSLGIAVPVLSACGCVCDLLPTAVLSTHTGGFEGFTFLDLTDEIPKITAHWKTLSISYDVIYSGYLGSKRQVELVKAIRRDFLKPNGKFVVDPVLGDHGKLYTNFDESFVDAMRELCKEADHILPNITEASYLTALPYGAPPERLLEELKKLCPSPIVTSADTESETRTFYPGGVLSLPLAPGIYHGTGDAFASAFTACIARGLPVSDCVSVAGRFSTRAVSLTPLEADKRYGIEFEAAIPYLLELLSGKETLRKIRARAIDYFGSDVSRIHHMLKVLGFAQLIAEGEKLSERESFLLSACAILHDIGIPESEKKYGNANGKNQEKEGPPVARALLSDLTDEETTERICRVVSLHHSYSKIGGDKILQMLVEADMLVNARDEEIPRESLALFKERVFRTESGKKYLEKLYLV